MTPGTLDTPARVPPLAPPQARRSNAGSTHSPSANLQSAQHSFLSILGRSTAAQASKTPDAQAREAAQQFVSTTLVQPLLKQLREMEDAAPPFAAGPGEKQFRALMDVETAQRITSAGHFPLVDRVAQQLLKKLGRGEALPDMPTAPPDAALNRPTIGITAP
jgi:Rod binding domain-containing protein